MRSKNSHTFSESEFRELYFEYHPVLFRVAMYVLKDEAEAEDVVQETFLKLWKLNDHKEITNLKAYLISMTRNACLDQIRSSDKEREKILELKHEVTDEEAPEQEDSIRKALEEAVSQLPPKCRLIFSLSRFEGLSNEEIAEYLDISKRTVETQISLALKAFRGDLRPIFEAHLPSLAAGFITLLLQQI
jgi:RNA polymerase sigma-70 factor (ECF subfamily)